MAGTALGKDLKPTDIQLADLYLDPNNPRFVEHDWMYIPDDQIANEAVQDATRLRLINEFAIEKIRMNMEINGYLPIDRVIVRKFAESMYVVLEGNRRICAAKMISQYSTDGSSISEDILNSLNFIPCLVYVGGESNAAWIFQGLRHITGYQDWSAFNKAKLLVEQMEAEGLSQTMVGKRFGLTPYGAGQWIRGYHAFKQASEKSDYIHEVDERAYPYFQELFGRSSARVREWMEWNEDEKRFKNELNFNEFVSWLYRRPTSNNNGDETEDGKDRPGDWERRALKSRDDIRQIAFLLQEDKEVFEHFRRELDIEKAYSEALSKKYQKEAQRDFDPGEEVFNTVKLCAKALNDIPYRLLKNPDTKRRLLISLKELEDAIYVIKD
jgi:hypothetical protein